MISLSNVTTRLRGRGVRLATTLLLLLGASCSYCWAAEKVGATLNWETLPALPDAHGVAGAFAGAHNGALIVAGGANFPGEPP